MHALSWRRWLGDGSASLSQSYTKEDVLFTVLFCSSPVSHNLPHFPPLKPNVPPPSQIHCSRRLLDSGEFRDLGVAAVRMSFGFLWFYAIRFGLEFGFGFGNCVLDEPSKKYVNWSNSEL
ncbi:unnamed protein product [Cochlearia groenlandica]